jgi:hypothetical protein
MMRKALASEVGVRKSFVATFSRLGKKVNFKGHSEDTILLVDIKDEATQQVVADHMWFAYTKGFEKITLTLGVKIAFDARVSDYKKGYVNKRYGINQAKKDFRLSHPTKIRLIS